MGGLHRVQHFPRRLYRSVAMAPKAVKAEAKKEKKKATWKRTPKRLYAKATILGHKGSKVNRYPRTTLMKIAGVNTREDTQFYLGKRVAYVYRAKREIRNSRFRVLWGKVCTGHGTSGLVQAKFRKNMPPRA